MVKPEDIGYELEIQENVSSEDLEKEYWGNVLMWVSGSTDASNSVSKYRILLQYKDVKNYYEKIYRLIHQIKHACVEYSMYCKPCKNPVVFM